MKRKEPVSKLMSLHIYHVHRHHTLWDVQVLMDKHSVRHIPVMDGDEVVGIISRTDLMRVTYGSLSRAEMMTQAHGMTSAQVEENKLSLQALKAEDVMSPKPYVISPSTSIHEAAEILANFEFSALPVVEHGKLVGMLTSTDLLRFLLTLSWS